MANTVLPSTWIQALSIRLERILGVQQPSSTGSNPASAPVNPTENAANHDDEWGDWVILAPEGEEQVKKDAPLLVEELEEDRIRMLKLAFEELIARQRIMVGQREEVDKDQKSSDGEKEEDLFHLEEIPAGIRMPCHTPPDFDVTWDIGPCILDLGMSGGRWQVEPGKSQARKGQHPLMVGSSVGSFWHFENDNAEGRIR